MNRDFRAELRIPHYSRTTPHTSCPLRSVPAAQLRMNMKGYVREQLNSDASLDIVCVTPTRAYFCKLREEFDGYYSIAITPEERDAFAWDPSERARF